MTREPAISVVIPCYNGADVLPLQLEALHSQEDAPPHEVIVVDNRSTDNFSGVVNAFGERGMPIRVVAAHEYAGTSYARNVGAASAEAPLLMFCDADDVVSRWWLAQGLRAFQDSPFWSGSAVPVREDEFGGSVEALRERIGDSALWEPFRGTQSGVGFPVLMGAVFGVTRDVFIGLRGFDLTLPVRGEDNDLAIRATRSGYGLPVAPSVRIAYRVRTEAKARRRAVYRDAHAHALLAARYDLWGESRFRHWLNELTRTALNAPRRIWTKGSREAWLERAARTLGWVRGNLQYRYRPGPPPPMLAVGLEEAS